MDPVDDAVGAFEHAALGMGEWSDAIGRLTQAAGGHVGHLGGVGTRGELLIHHLWGVTSAQAEDYIASGGPDAAVNPRTRAIIDAAGGTVLVDGEILPDRQRSRHAFYNGFLHRNDVPHGAMMKLVETDHCQVGLTLMRSRRAGPVEDGLRHRLTLIAPRLGMMIRTALLMQARQVSLCTTAIDAIDSAVFMLDDHGRVIDMSAAAEGLLARSVHLASRGGRIGPRCPDAGAAFDAALQATRRDGGRLARTTTLALPALSRASTLKVDFVPMPPEASAWLRPGICLLIAHAEVERGIGSGLETMGLTASEMHVARMLLAGRRAEEIAVERGVSIGTTRNQIKAVLAKSGRSRQIDFVRDHSTGLR